MQFIENLKQSMFNCCKSSRKSTQDQDNITNDPSMIEE